jgi:hypothetical protein
MILYHGSNTIVDKVDLLKCRPYKDFGRGFYLTDIKEQAIQMAKRVVRLYGGSAYVSKFELDDTVFTKNILNLLRFDMPNRYWAMFVINNRDRKWHNFGDQLCNQDNKYDVVLGPVANDDIAYLFRTFTNGLINIDTLVQGLQYKKLTTQFSFHTKKALTYLKFKGVLNEQSQVSY